LSPLTPMTESNVQGSTPDSSSPILNPLLDSSRSYSCSASSSHSPDYLSSPTISHGQVTARASRPCTPCIRPLPALRIPASFKKHFSPSKKFQNVPRIAHSATQPRTQKRRSGSGSGCEPAAKRARSSSDDSPLSSLSLLSDDSTRKQEASPADAPHRRHFPANIPINPDFEQMYRRFPVPSFVSGEPNK
jgi:hypothetical protein